MAGISVDEVRAATEKVLRHAGGQMPELGAALDDLLWDVHEPYHRLSVPSREAFRAAVEAELNGGHEGEAAESNGTGLGE